MKISVVIPAYNEEKYIADTLRAVLEQSHKDFEVIVVSNACTDRTEEIARTFGVKVLREEEVGAQRTREKGRLEAKGELIASLDADCLPEKDWLVKAESYFNHPEVIAVTGPYDYYNGSDFFRSFSLIIQKYIYRYFNNVLVYSHFGGVLIMGNSIMRADALNKIGGYDTTILFYGDDTDTAKRLSAVGKIIFAKDLVMKSSARRFKQEGTVKIASKYIFHFVKTTFSGVKKLKNLTN